jgi:hypothetical protein
LVLCDIAIERHRICNTPGGVSAGLRGSDSDSVNRWNAFDLH